MFAKALQQLVGLHLTSSASMCLFFWLKNFDGLEKVERSWDIGCLPVFTGFLSPPTPQGRGYPCF